MTPLSRCMISFSLSFVSRLLDRPQSRAVACSRFATRDSPAHHNINHSPGTPAYILQMTQRHLQPFHLSFQNFVLFHLRIFQRTDFPFWGTSSWSVSFRFASFVVWLESTLSLWCFISEICFLRCSMVCACHDIHAQPAT